MVTSAKVGQDVMSASEPLGMRHETPSVLYLQNCYHFLSSSSSSSSFFFFLKVPPNDPRARSVTEVTAEYRSHPAFHRDSASRL